MIDYKLGFEEKHANFIRRIGHAHKMLTRQMLEIDLIIPSSI
jgi:hypothetical protein